MRLHLIIVFTMVLVLLGGAVGAWNVVADFSTVSNPNGPWAYGYWLGGVFTSGTSITNHRSYTGLNGWGNSADPLYTPYVVQNTTASTMLQLFQAFDLAGGAIFMHPGDNGDEGTIMFTAPVAGVYDVDFSFTKLDLKNSTPPASIDTQIVSIYSGATSLGSSQLSPTNQTWSLVQQLTLAQGDNIYFRVAADGNYNGDSTGVVGGITLVPEPGSMLALLSGFIACAGTAVRRRRA